MRWGRHRPCGPLDRRIGSEDANASGRILQSNASLWGRKSLAPSHGQPWPLFSFGQAARSSNPPRTGTRGVHGGPVRVGRQSALRRSTLEAGPDPVLVDSAGLHGGPGSSCCRVWVRSTRRRWRVRARPSRRLGGVGARRPRVGARPHVLDERTGEPCPVPPRARARREGPWEAKHGIFQTDGHRMAVEGRVGNLGALVRMFWRGRRDRGAPHLGGTPRFQAPIGKRRRPR